MRRLALACLALLVLSVSARADTRVFGWCEQGNYSVTVGGLTSGTQKFQRSFPNCTVTVYDAGTLDLTDIFSDDNGTPRANPFTADATGYWFFYVPDGCYDVRFSGAGIPSPFTLGDICVFGGFTSGGVIIEDNTDTDQSFITLIGGDGLNNTVPPFICGIPSPGDTSPPTCLFPCADGNWGISQGKPTSDCTPENTIVIGGTGVSGPCGDDTQIQFNKAGVFGCDEAFTVDYGTNKRLQVIGDIVISHSDPTLGKSLYYDSDFGYQGFINRSPKVIFERTSASSSSTAVTNPTSGVNNTFDGTEAWANPGNILSSNNAYATVTLVENLSNDVSNWLEGKTFGLAVPTGATITGVVATVEGQKTGGSAGAVVRVRLSLAGTPLAVTEKIDGAGSYGSGSDVTVTYGSSSDSWNTVLTPANVNSSGFGVAVQLEASGTFGSSINFAIDHITVRVYYQTDDTGVLSVVGNFQLKNGTDISKVVSLDTSLITTATTRTQQFMDEDGVICLVGFTCDGSGSGPAGGTGDVQFNTSGAFDAEAAFNYNKTSNTLLFDHLSLNAGVTNDGGLQHERITTGSCGTTGCQVTLTWDVSFGDTNYTPVCSVEDSTSQSEVTGLRIAKISSRTATTVVVDIDNFSGSGVTGTLHCWGAHD